MAGKNRPMWIVVMDGNAARFFALRRGEEGQVFDVAAETIEARRIAKSEKPGRGFSFSGRDERGEKFDTTQLARDVCSFLDSAFAGKHFEELGLVAPARVLAELREQLTPRLKVTVVQQLSKNLSKLSTEQLWEKLSPVLRKAAKPVNGASTTQLVEQAAIPLSVVFRNMAPSQSAEAEAMKHATKLSKKGGRILNCRVTVEAPKHEHRKVKEFRVAVAMKLPGREIATKSGEGESHTDLSSAMRAAFASILRQMEGHMQRMKREVLRTRRKASPRLSVLQA
ncbi:protein required for attachment to host cells/ribosome-associated translation inhibitor RaiA [Rhizomicrobium palustre]|uniref:Protein required for attachment to host cells/ribosome-associated translation inhibitor RaiA n=1 Tax=Rhizomicrobium palustre TaxID=189966 RepID=A0A846N493_9PROT|nr:host attachment protein [Rhizomicrobium palustre]NIK89870.1 protein required for attachment to host cells/ribosome-associated translation inhibitor RaiA [Rhizomicrobium palustre]